MVLSIINRRTKRFTTCTELIEELRKKGRNINLNGLYEKLHSCFCSGKILRRILPGGSWAYRGWGRRPPDAELKQHVLDFAFTRAPNYFPLYELQDYTSDHYFGRAKHGGAIVPILRLTRELIAEGRLINSGYGDFYCMPPDEWLLQQEQRIAEL